MIRGLAVLFLLVIFHSLEAQVVTVDPALTVATGVASSVENNHMSNMEKKQKTIETAQLITAKATNFINTWQQKTLKGLTEVSGTVSNVWGIMYAGQYIVSIGKNYGKMLVIAKGDPLLLAFTAKMQTSIVERATLAYSKLHTLILKQDPKLLLTAGERMNLLRQLNEELAILDALTYTCIYTMERIREKGLINSINPFYYEMKNDATMVNEILNRWSKF